MSEEIQENRDDGSGACAGRPAAKARPKQASSPISSSPTIKIPYHLRVWIDVEPREYDEHSFEVSKTMTKLLRHDRSVVREKDGAIEFKILTPMFASQFESSSYWSIRTRLRYLQRGGGHKKSFQHCLDPYSAETLLYLRAINSSPFWKKLN